MVGLWSATGQLLATVTVQAGREAELDSDWRYIELDHAVRLEAGDVFYLGAVVTADDPFYYSYPDIGTSGGVGGILGSDGVLKSGNKGDGWQISTSLGFIVPPQWAWWWPNYAANAQFEMVPEPASALICLFAVGGLTVRRKRRQMGPQHVQAAQ
jgi:hypothetical protein